jgi:hypothetical protein
MQLKEGELMSSFVDLCVSGSALTEQIDDYIEEWHNDSKTTKSLHEFLGMTKDEYGCYLANHEILPYIIYAHKHKQSFDEILANVPSYQEAFAARSSNLEKVKALISHLKKHH